MTIFLISTISVAIIIILLFWQYKTTQATVKLLGNAVLNSIEDFNCLYQFSHFFTESEAIEYKSKYNQLYDQVKPICKSFWIKSKDVKEYRFTEFIEIFDSISIKQKYNNKVYCAISVVNDKLEVLWRAQNAFNAYISYHSNHSLNDHKRLCESLVESIIFLEKETKIQFVENPSLAREFKKDYDYTISESGKKEYNDLFVVKKKEEDKDFFETCLKYPLDEQQREAILRMEDNTLVISSAGSGKTSTMVGKARYMVDNCTVSPDDILIITYTRKAAEELSSRLNIEGLTCSTFHALAVKIISEVTGHKPSICEQDLLLNSFYELLHSNTQFLCAVNRYMLEMKSLMKLEHDYNTAYEYYNDRKKYGIQATFPDMEGDIIFTKSEEEKRICEWLSIHKVDFLYENPYPFETSNKEHRQYKPDFTIFYKDKNGNARTLYYEHYAINSKGDVPYWFGTDINNPCQDSASVAKRWMAENKKYNEGIKWKEDTHKQHKTNLISTTSAMFHDGSVWNNLERSLEKHGVPFMKLSPEELHDMLVKRNRGLEKSLFKLIEQFIALQKCNCLNYIDLIQKSKELHDIRSEFIIKEIIKPVAVSYQNNLDKRKLIDFTDAITEATKLCNDGKWKFYEYILIDEFQDISVDRYKFLLSLRTDEPGKFTKLFCVGDDWQSIYRFSGSDMSLFYDFEKYFGVTENCKIETTYRFYEPMITLSSNFVQKNPFQVTKKIKDSLDSNPKIKQLIGWYNDECESQERGITEIWSSPDEDVQNECHKSLASSGEFLKSMEERIQFEKSKYKTNIDFHYYSSESDEKAQIEGIIRRIPQEETILILGRYNYDVGSLGYQFTPQDADKKVIYITLCGRRIRFMSVHGAKGLEADHVILLNCNQGTNGFPSLIEDDPILNFVLSDKDTYENAEERRVFYVAITRAKKITHVFYDVKKPSCFVEEFIGFMNKSEEIPCPTCGHGHIKIMKEGQNSYGTWLALGCSNYGAGCPFFMFSTPEKFSAMKDDFDERNSVESVQAKGIDSTKRISSYLTELRAKSGNSVVGQTKIRHIQ